MEFTLLINMEDMLAYTQIDGSVDFDKLKPTINNCQKQFIENMLGSDLYDKIISDINNDNIEYETLLYEYITPCLALHTMCVFEPLNSTIVSDAGTVQYSLTNAAAAARQEIDRKVKLYEGQAQMYDTRLIKYLCDNSDLYPEYNNNTGEVKTINKYPNVGWNLNSSIPKNKYRE